MKLSEVQLPSNRKFGIFFTFVFVATATYFFWEGSTQVSAILGVLATVFALVTIIKSELLLPLNKLWMSLGLLLGMIISPIVLGGLFFFLFTPIAFLMRLVGRDELRLKKLEAKSYWKSREPSGPSGDSFKHQF